jgi:hypothetical protein
MTIANTADGGNRRGALVLHRSCFSGNIAKVKPRMAILAERRGKSPRFERSRRLTMTCAGKLLVRPSIERA